MYCLVVRFTLLSAQSVNGQEQSNSNLRCTNFKQGTSNFCQQVNNKRINGKTTEVGWKPKSNSHKLCCVLYVNCDNTILQRGQCPIQFWRTTCIALTRPRTNAQIRRVPRPKYLFFSYHKENNGPTRINESERRITCDTWIRTGTNDAHVRDSHVGILLRWR